MQLSSELVFLVAHMQANLACELQHIRKHLHIERVCPKVQFQKIPVFLVVSVSRYTVLKVKIEVDS